MKKIIDYLDLVGVIHDEGVAYNIPNEGQPPFPFTLAEFDAALELIWKNAGGWDASDKYQVKDAYFETYYVPFEFEGKNYWMHLMSGQGTAWFLLTEKEHQEAVVRLAELDAMGKELDELNNDE